jgi:hypothetical protein
MNVEGQPVERNQVLLYPRIGKTTVYREAEVIDIEEHVNAVKLRYGVGKDGIRSQWFPAASLRRTQPKSE